jgi:hypothetical protein
MVMLADHLGSGDYSITRVVFVVLLIATVVVLVVAIRATYQLNRVLALAAAVLLLFTAVGMHERWQEVTDAADRLTGPAGSDLQFSELDHFVQAVFGDFPMFALLAMIVAACIGAIRRRAIGQVRRAAPPDA